MKIIKLANHMFYEETQSDEEWKKHFELLRRNIDEAYSKGNYELAEKLDVQLEAFLEKAEAYKSETEEGRSNEDLEPEPGDGTHYAEFLAPLYEEYLMAEKGVDVHHRFLSFDEPVDLENKLAYYVYQIMIEYVDMEAKDYFVPDDGSTYQATMYPSGKIKEFVRDYTTTILPKKVEPLVGLAKNVWEDKVEHMKKINPNWAGYHGYLEERK